MALRRKGSAPWSLTKDTGLSDAPVSGSPFVEGDEVKPVIDAGYIDGNGLWQINPSDDLAFTFQDPNQALAAGADLEFNINMLNHDILILGVSDSSGNAINVDLLSNNPTILTGPYSPFSNLGGVNGDAVWQINKNRLDGALHPILEDASVALSATWQFFKIDFLKGCAVNFRIHNNDGSNAGTISTAYMRLV